MIWGYHVRVPVRYQYNSSSEAPYLPSVSRLSDAALDKRPLQQGVINTTLNPTHSVSLRTSVKVFRLSAVRRGSRLHKRACRPISEIFWKTV